MMPVPERDTEKTRRRTRVCVTTSAIAHALLVVALVLVPHHDSGALALTEITLIEPGELGGAESAAPAAYVPAEQTATGAAASGETDAAFTRTARRADIHPDPEAPAALDDRISSRLATLRTEALDRTATAPAPGLSSALRGTPSLSPAGIGGTGRAPLALTRGGGSGDGPSLRLTRGGGVAAAPAIAAAGLPEERPEPARPAGGESSARRNLAGAILMGPIADRPVLSHVTPAYPEWAKREGVEGSTTLYFIVGPEGGVRENVLVQKTAGFEDFDESARSALRAWRFAPLRGGMTGEQWGTITFHFRLREAP